MTFWRLEIERRQHGFADPDRLAGDDLAGRTYSGARSFGGGRGQSGKTAPARFFDLEPSRGWPISAGRVLSRICKHAGYLKAFVYDEPESVDVSKVGGTANRAETSAKQRRAVANVMRSKPVASEVEL